ncbi:hypothetical protein ABZ468_36790 [Streptomyces sp. NPDC005708]|uniref:hypothetical protein n=1 Tax=unclassified Streptomyces TaxID=2593676 RepID=UPI0033E626EB
MAHFDTVVRPAHLAGVGEQALDHFVARAVPHLCRVIVEAADAGFALQRDSAPLRHQRLSSFSAFDGALKSPAGTLVGFSTVR